MREIGDKAKRKKEGEGRKGVGERSRGREKEEEWENTTPRRSCDGSFFAKGVLVFCFIGNIEKGGGGAVFC
jgi:hypothetical protein